jgi:hypothetical protein
MFEWQCQKTVMLENSPGQTNVPGDALDLADQVVGPQSNEYLESTLDWCAGGAGGVIGTCCLQGCFLESKHGRADNMIHEAKHLCQRRNRMDTKLAVENGSSSGDFSSKDSLKCLLPSSPF